MHLIPWRPLRQHSWKATRAGARLGTIAAALAGAALYFHLGGQDGYTVPLSGLLGMPMNGWLLRLLPDFHLSSAGRWSEWDLNHLAFCAGIAINWTAIGFLIDLVRVRSAEPPPSENRGEPLSLFALAEVDLLTEELRILERTAVRPIRKDGVSQRAA